MGVVISVKRNMPTRPVVKLITNQVGVLLTSFPEVDLIQEKTLFIHEIVSEKERNDIIDSK